MRTAIAPVDRDAAGLNPGRLFEFGNHWTPGVGTLGVAVERVAVQRLGMQHKPTASGLGRRGAIALGCTVASTTTRSRSRIASAPVWCATARRS